MAQAVQRARITWQTGSQQRSDKHFRPACELARNGVLGKIHTVRVGLPGGTPDFGRVASQTETVEVPEGFNYRRWLGSAPAAPYCPARVGVNFRWCRDYSGGQLTDWGAHHIDCAQWGLGTEMSGPVAIRNAKGRFAQHPVYNTAVEFSFECEYADGVKMIVSSSERQGVKFEGADGWVWVNRGKHECSSADIEKAAIPEGGVHLYESDDHVKNFVDCVFSGKPTAAPIDVAHRSVSIAHLGNIALTTGRDIRWDPKLEKIEGDATASGMLIRTARDPFGRE
jgi:predicted dehydrogenase